MVISNLATTSCLHEDDVEDIVQRGVSDIVKKSATMRVDFNAGDGRTSGVRCCGDADQYIIVRQPCAILMIAKVVSDLLNFISEKGHRTLDR